jgi:hypothetical protein
MKYAITFLMLAMLGAMIVTGCKASASVGKDSTSVNLPQ